MYAIVHSYKVRLILPQSNPYTTLSQGQKCPLQPRIQYKVEISVPVRVALPWILLVAEMALLIINGKVFKFALTSRYESLEMSFRKLNNI